MDICIYISISCCLQGVLFEVGSVWLEPHKVLGDICFGCLWLKNLGLGWSKCCCGNFCFFWQACYTWFLSHMTFSKFCLLWFQSHDIFGWCRIMTNFSFEDCILPGDPGRNHGSGRKSQFAVVGHLGFAGFTSTDYSRIAISIHGRNSSSSSTSPTSTPISPSRAKRELRWGLQVVWCTLHTWIGQSLRS